MELIKNISYKMMPWKNGLGETAQIDIYPASASFPDGDFWWRLSTATFKESTPFSSFPECDRILMVWKGGGLKLHDRVLEPFMAFAFAGDKPMDAEPLGGEISDFGVIFRKDKVKVEVLSEEFTKEVTPVGLDGGIHYFFCASGKMAVNQNVIDEGDTIKADGNQSVKLSGNLGTRYVHVIVTPRSQGALL